MPRSLDPRLDEALDRANPYVEYMPEISAPDVGRVLRRASDQFFTSPDPQVSMTPSASAVASASGQIVLASSGSAVATFAVKDDTWDANLFPPDRFLKALGWQVDPTFKGGTLRTFKALIHREPVFSTNYLPVDFALRIVRATGQPLFNKVSGESKTLWTFADLLPEPEIAKWVDVTWSSDDATVEFDLSRHFLRIDTASQSAPTANSTGELPVYYFQVSTVKDIHLDERYNWYADSTTTRTVSGVGTFARRWWTRDNADAEWTETVNADTYCATIELESYVDESVIVYEIDMGAAPASGTTGRVVFERAEPAGTTATLEISTTGGTGSGGGGIDTLYSWNAGDAVTDLTRSGSASYIDPNGVLTSAAANVARVGRDPEGERGLILESSRTNGWTYSADYTQPVWGSAFAEVQPNAGTGPDGVSAVCKIAPDTNSVATHRLSRNLPTVTDDTHQTVTVILKAAGYGFAGLNTIDQSGASWTSVVNLTDGSTETLATPHAIVATELADDWWMFAVTSDSDSGSTTMQWRTLVYSDAAGSAFAGDGTKGILAAYHGVEVDKGFGSSPILTTSATATRSAESLTVEDGITGAGVGVSATLYVHYYNRATAAVVETVSAITSVADIVFTADRIWRSYKVAAGTQTLATMQAAGPGADWSTVKHGDEPSVAQQKYWLRLTMDADTANRQTPTVAAVGVEYRTPHDVSAESIVSPLAYEVGVPFLEPSIAEGTLTLIRTGVRDYEDTASTLGSTKPAPKLEVDLYLGSRHPDIERDAWFLMDRATVSQRSPTESGETFTLLSYSKILKRKVPAKTESVNTVHTVTGTPTRNAVAVSPALTGATSGGDEYDSAGYYMRVRSSSNTEIPAGYVQTIDGNTGTDTLVFLGLTPLPGLLSSGDVIEVHSAQYAEPVLSWADEDPADVWWEVLTTLAGAPPERIGRADLGRAGRGGLPPKVTDITSDATTQAKLKVSNRIKEAKESGKIIDALSFLMGGVTVEIGGQFVFRQVYSLKDESGNITVPADPPAALFDPRDYYGLSTPVGLEERVTLLSCDYGVNANAADPDAFPASTAVVVDADALDWLTQQDLEDVGASEVPDEIAAWCYNSADAGLLLATRAAQQVVGACSTGKRTWTWSVRDARPDLCIGDRVTILTDQYTDYDPSAKQEIRGWWAYTLVLVGVSEGGRHFTGFLPGLASAKQVRGGPGSLQGAGAAIAIPSDFLCAGVVLGSPTGAVAYINATYTVSNPFLDHMEYSVRARPATGGAWGAASVVVGSRGGVDKISATPNTEVEITPITVSSGGTRWAGTGTEIKTVTLSSFTTPDIVTGDITVTAGSAAITYEITNFEAATYVRAWRKTYTSATVPGSAVSVEGVGTEMTRFEPGGITVQQGGALDVTNDREIVTFIAYDANNTRGAPLNVLTPRATPTAPSAPASAAAVSHTASSVTNGVVMPASVTNADTIRVYRDGVRYGDVTRTAAANATQNVVSTSLSPGTAYSWQYSLVHTSDGGESAKTTAFVVTTTANQIPTPSCGVAYNVPGQEFAIHVLPGPDGPTGVKWHLKIGTVNPPTVEATSSASTSTTLSYPSAQGAEVTFYAIVWGVKAGWTTSEDSDVASGVRPAKETSGGDGPPIDPT